MFLQAVPTLLGAKCLQIYEVSVFPPFSFVRLILAYHAHLCFYTMFFFFVFWFFFFMDTELQSQYSALPRIHRGFFTGAPTVPQLEDAQVVYVKWCSTVGLPSVDAKSAGTESRLYVFKAEGFLHALRRSFLVRLIVPQSNCPDKGRHSEPEASFFAPWYWAYHTTVVPPCPCSQIHN